MSTAIRELGISDSVVLRELLDHLEPGWTDALAPSSGPMAFISDAKTFVFGAYVDNEVAGWLWGDHARRPEGTIVTTIEHVAVLEPYRRRGIAASLLEAALGAAQRAGAASVHVAADPSDPGVTALLESLGATISANHNHYRWAIA